MKRHAKGVHVVLADDHAILLEGLRTLLDHTFEIVGCASGGRDLVTLTLRCKPDVVVTDINMPDLDGIEAVSQIRSAGLPVRVVFLTMLDDVKIALRAFQCVGGAAGYVLKHSASIELVTAIQEVLAGRSYITPRISGSLLREYFQSVQHSPEGLTTRQTEVLRLVAQGKTMKEVASVLNISTRTAEAHKYQMMEHLGIRTTAQLVQFALQHRLVAPPTAPVVNGPEICGHFD